MSRSKVSDADVIFRTEVAALVETLIRSRRPWPLRRARRQFERFYTEYVIRRSDDDRHRAARRLSIGFSTLKEKIRKTRP